MVVTSAIALALADDAESRVRLLTEQAAAYQEKIDPLNREIGRLEAGKASE